MANKDFRAEFTKLFANVDEVKAKALDEETLKLIDHVHGRVSYTDEKHRNSFQAHIALLTFAVALGVFLNEYNGHWLVAAIPIVIGLSVVGASGVILFVFQDRFKRPFIGVAQTWRWFYHYCIDPRIPAGPFLTCDQREESKREYLRGLYQYAKNTLVATPQEMLKQDIEQLFILLTSERLKNEFLKQSQGILLYGFIASLTAFLSNLVLLHFLPAYALSISLVIFVVIFVVTLILKVAPTTKSRQNWTPIEIA